MTGGLVSVVVPTDRVSPYFREALGSVVAQTHPRWEIVVVADGCAEVDALAAVLDEVVPGRHRLIRQGRRGVSVARNVGARAARGDLLVFLDDDDLFAPDRLGRQVALLAAAPSCGVCFSGGTHIDDAGTRVAGWRAFPADTATMLSGSTPIPRIQTLMFRTEVFAELGGFNSSIRFCQDHDLTLRALQLTPFCGVEAELASYRRHPANHTARPAVEILTAAETVLRYQWAAARQRDPVAARALRSNLHTFVRRSAHQCGQDFAVAVGAGQVLAAARSAWWGMSRDSTGFVAGAAARGAAYLARRVRRLSAAPAQ